MLVTLAALLAPLASPAPPQDPAPAADVLVRVLEPDGSPAVDVPVVLRERTRFDRWRAPRSARKFSVHTNADGRAVIPAEYATERYAALLFGDEAILSTEESPTTITLPPTGELRLDLTAWPRLTRVWLDADRRGLRVWNGKRSEEPELRLRHVPLGLDFRGGVEAHRFGRSVLEFSGPTAAGEVTAVIPVIDASVGVRLRFVDAEGEDVRGVTARFSGGDTELGPSSFGGRVSDRVWASELDRSAPPEIVVTGGRVGRGPVSLGTRWPEPERNGWLDFGEVTVERIPLLCAGRVVDTKGRPVADARVSIESRSTRRRALKGLGGRFGVPSYGDRWRTVSATTGHDGRFALYAVDAADLEGPQPEEEEQSGRFFHLNVWPPLLEPTVTPVRFLVGDDDLEIVLERPGRISVDTDPLLRVPKARVHFERVGIPSARTPLRSGRGEPRPKLAPGVYDIRVVVDELELARLRGFGVDPGSEVDVSAETLEEALLPFDVLTQRFVDTHGNPVTDACVFLVDDEGRWPAVFEADDRKDDGEDAGRVRWVRPDTDEVYGEVHGFGVEPHVLLDEADGATVTLRSHPWARLNVSGGFAGDVLHVRNTERHWRQGAQTEVKRSGNGVFRVRVERGVPYQVRASHTDDWVEFVLLEGEDTLELELD